MTLAELTPEWAQQALTATTRSHEQGRRQTYIYLHDLLYPLYAQLPAFLDDEQRHQFLVFADDETLKKQKDNGYKLYWIAIGKTDFLYPNNVEYRKKLDSLSMPYKYRESEGGHVWRNWRVYLTEFTPMLFR